MSLEWVQIISLGVNAGTLIGLIKVVRQAARLELKVELMWNAFQKKLGLDNSDES